MYLMHIPQDPSEDYLIMNTIIDGTKTFNASCITYPPMKVLANGGKIMNVRNSAANNAFRISSPLMLTWGATDYEGNEKFELSLQFPNSDNQTPGSNTFLENMKAFENKIKADAIKNSKEWLGKAKISPEVLDAMWTPMLKYPKDKETGEFDLTRDPVLRIKFNKIRDQYQCNIYDENAQPLWLRDEADNYPEKTPMEFFKKGMHTATVMECGGIWFMANGKLGVTWRLMQAATQKPVDNVFSKCMLTINSDDKKVMQKAVATEDDEDEDDMPSGRAAVSTAVEESDEEEEEEEEEEDEEEEEVSEPVPEPVKPVKKKVVRAKK